MTFIEDAKTYETAILIISQKDCDQANVRLSKPICKKLPDISEIVNGGRVRAVAFCEAVVESQGTLTEAIRVINEEVKKIDSGLSVPAFEEGEESFWK